MAAALDERLERYADLAVEVGANVQEGQNVFLSPDRARAARSCARPRRLRRRRALCRRLYATSTCAAR